MFLVSIFGTGVGLCFSVIGIGLFFSTCCLSCLSHWEENMFLFWYFSQGVCHALTIRDLSPLLWSFFFFLPNNTFPSLSLSRCLSRLAVMNDWRKKRKVKGTKGGRVFFLSSAVVGLLLVESSRGGDFFFL